MRRVFLAILVLVLNLFSINTFAAGPSYNWTGFYVGLQGSYITGSSDWSFDAGTSTDHSLNGGIGGIYLGYNYQLPFNLVLGIASDIGAGNISGSDSCPNLAYDCKSKTSWLGATRFRLGYAIDSFLPYISIGIAYTEIKLSAEEIGTGAEWKAKDSYIGWTPAIGFDFAITNNLLANFEYAYYDFGKEKTKLIYGAMTDPLENKVKFHGFKLGLSWKF